MNRLSLIFGLMVLVGCGGDPDDTSKPKPNDPPVDPFHDALSRPETPTEDIANYNSAETCATCHEDHYEQWSTSMHAYAMTDPVYKALVAIRQDEFDGAQDQFCTQCHSAIGVRSHDLKDGFAWEELDPITVEGVTCEACHKISSIDRTNNAGHVFDATGPIRGPIADPVDNAFHESEYSPMFDESELCGSCHDVIELDGLNLERPYEEWLESPAAEEGRNCQSCHMPEYQGEAAPGAPTRTLHLHEFVGVDVPLDLDFATLEQREMVRERVVELLDNAATVLLSADETVKAGEQLDLLVNVRNELDAHNLPTGSTFIRQLWLEVVATDVNGTVLYETGTLDDNGDLRNYWSTLDPYGDEDLISFSSGFVDEVGNPSLLSWQSAEHFSNTIPPLYDRTYTLFIPTELADVGGPVTVRSRLRFRTHAPYLLTILDLEYLLPDIEIYDLDAHEIQVELTP